MTLSPYPLPPLGKRQCYIDYGLCLYVFSTHLNGVLTPPTPWTTMIRLTIKFPVIFCIKQSNYLSTFSPIPFLKILSYYCAPPPPPPFYNTFFENTQFQFIMTPPPHTHTFENIMTCVTLLPPPPPLAPQCNYTPYN